MRHWIFSCKQISGMISESMDQELPFSQRMGIRFHLMMCKLCTRYQKQLFFIRETLHPSTSPGLSHEGRNRIRENLLDKTRDSD